MTPSSETACPIAAVKAQLLASFEAKLDEWLSSRPLDEHSAELATWAMLLPMLSDEVAAGEGAFRTCTERSPCAMWKSSRSAPTASTA